MKRLVIGFILSTVVLTGCTGAAYEAYSSASKRTEAALYGKTKMSLNMDIDFKVKDKTLDEIRDLEPWRKIVYESLMTYDRERGQELVELYVKAYNLGFEAKLYIDDDRTLLVSPLFPKIVSVKGIDNLKLSSFESNRDFGIQISQKTLDEIKEIWMEVINSEDRTKIGNIIISTPEGELKAKEYIMNLKDEELKPAMKKTVEIILGDEAIKKMIKDLEGETPETKYINIVASEEVDILLENVKIEKFIHRAFIDRDGFIAEETVKVKLDFSSVEGFIVNGISLDLNIQNWDLGKRLDITFPELRGDNVMLIDEVFELNIIPKL